MNNIHFMVKGLLLSLLLGVAACGSDSEVVQFDPNDKKHLANFLLQQSAFVSLPVELFEVDLRSASCEIAMKNGEKLGLRKVVWPEKAMSNYYEADATGLFKGQEARFTMICTPDDRLIRATYYFPSFMEPQLGVALAEQMKNKLGAWTVLDGNLKVGAFDATWDRRLNHSISVKRYWPRTDVIIEYRNDLLVKTLEELVKEKSDSDKAALKGAL